MSSFINRLADRVLAAVLPSATADAACVAQETAYCYCSKGLAYRRIFYKCNNSDGSTTYIWSNCQVTGTC